MRSLFAWGQNLAVYRFHFGLDCAGVSAGSWPLFASLIFRCERIRFRREKCKALVGAIDQKEKVSNAQENLNSCLWLRPKTADDCLPAPLFVFLLMLLFPLAIYLPNAPSFRQNFSSDSL
jgi:hypothetical protein